MQYTVKYVSVYRVCSFVSSNLTRNEVTLSSTASSVTPSEGYIVTNQIGINRLTDFKTWLRTLTYTCTNQTLHPYN